MAAAMNAKKDVQELGKPGAPRYQAWRPTAQKGSYLIDETVHISVTDPICTSKPRHRCTRDEVRKGSGEIPLPPDAKTRKNKGAAAGISAVEVDAGKNTLTVALPVPLFPAALHRDHHDRRARGHARHAHTQGPAARSCIAFGSTPPAGVMHDKPFTVLSRAGWRSQAGEQV